MTKPVIESLTDIEKDTNFYLARIRQIDKILEGSVKTVLRLAEDGKKRGERIPWPAESLIYFPTWISERVEPKEQDNLLTLCLCCATLQRLSRLRRRFSWLDKNSHEQLRALRRDLVNNFIPKKCDSGSDFDNCARILHSDTFGGLNPLTASQVFRVLLNAGEDHTHGSIGFLAFFAMIWPLCRRFPDPLTIGARIEPWEVSAYTTAKCLLPIKTLQTVITKRARLFDQTAENLITLKNLATKDSHSEAWDFNIELDDLSANLSRLSFFAIDKKAFRDCADKVEKIRASDSSNLILYGQVLSAVGETLIAVREKSNEVLTKAKEMVCVIQDRILKQLNADAHNELMKEPLRLNFAEEHVRSSEYWEDLRRAAERSLQHCHDALEELDKACKIFPEIVNWERDHAKIKDPATGREVHEFKDFKDRLGAVAAVISEALNTLAESNTEVSKILDKPVKDAASWCRNVVDREIAHVSAENLTDFDPSELVSGIAVAVGWDLMTTPLQVSDAVTKAIAGARKDGSWRSGKPFYSPNHASGIWAVTSDIVWTLTRAIEQFPEVREADDELFNYVNWLERTQISLRPDLRMSEGEEQQQAGAPTVQAKQGRKVIESYAGWASERLRDRRKIHLGTTALAISALLGIRDLAEYRLWELCKKRFSVITIDKGLRAVKPVDLGAKHSERLHSRLARMASDAQWDKYRAAEYSLVLHGPPGSSKTMLAEALSGEMWKFSSRWGEKDERRLIRITPADFTRLGEDRLDSEARVIFDLISGVRAVTILFDEIDDLLRQRNTASRPRFMDLVVPAMLNRLADLRSACPRQEICFLIATNYVENIDSALIRKGRIDDSIAVVYPDFQSRIAIISSNIKKAPNETVDRSAADKVCRDVAEQTQGWPYSAITSCCNVLRNAWKGTDDSRFQEALGNAIRNHKLSFSKPDYEARWTRLKRYSQELLNEYWHHLISQCADPVKHGSVFKPSAVNKKIEDLFRKVDQPNESSRSDPDHVTVDSADNTLRKMFKSLLEREGRITNTGSAPGSANPP